MGISIETLRKIAVTLQTKFISTPRLIEGIKIQHFDPAQMPRHLQEILDNISTLKQPVISASQKSLGEMTLAHLMDLLFFIRVADAYGVTTLDQQSLLEFESILRVMYTKRYKTKSMLIPVLSCGAATVGCAIGAGVLIAVSGGIAAAPLIPLVALAGCTVVGFLATIKTAHAAYRKYLNYIAPSTPIGHYPIIQSQAVQPSIQADIRCQPVPPIAPSIPPSYPSREQLPPSYPSGNSMGR